MCSTCELRTNFLTISNKFTKNVNFLKAWKKPELSDFFNNNMVSCWRFELQTLWLKVKCSTDWANRTYLIFKHKMAASDGLEPSECQSQSLMPYHLATRQSRNGGGTWIWTMEPEGTDLQSAAFDHFAIPPKINGADWGNRTPNLLITSQLRYQLR